MSVRETLDFSARCQGTGSRAGRFIYANCFYEHTSMTFQLSKAEFSPTEEILMEVSRREKQAGIIPEADIDTFMNVKNIFLHHVSLGIGRLVYFPFS